VIQQGGKNATGIQVPDDVVEELGAGKRPPVVVTINGYSYRSSVAVMGGVFMVGVSADTRERTGLAGGDEVEVDLALDTEPREVEVPLDLSEALAADAEASRVFNALSYSNKRRIVMPIDDAKSPETRQRRIAKSVEALRDGRA
jgi:hypothetical protein